MNQYSYLVQSILIQVLPIDSTLERKLGDILPYKRALIHGSVKLQLNFDMFVFQKQITFWNAATVTIRCVPFPFVTRHTL